MAKGIILVGGPCDGMKVAVPDDCTMHRVRERPPMTLAKPSNGPIACTVSVREGLYRAENDRQVFHWQGWIG